MWRWNEPDQLGLYFLSFAEVHPALRASREQRQRADQGESRPVSRTLSLDLEHLLDLERVAVGNVLVVFGFAVREDMEVGYRFDVGVEGQLRHHRSYTQAQKRPSDRPQGLLGMSYMPQQHPPVTCTKCKAVTTEGAWVAGLGFDYNGTGTLVAEARALCATCAATFPNEEVRIAFVTQVAADFWARMEAMKVEGQRNRDELRDHFFPCKHCGGTEIDGEERRSRETESLRMACKGCGAVFVDLKQPRSMEDLSLKVLQQLKAS